MYNLPSNQQNVEDFEAEIEAEEWRHKKKWRSDEVIALNVRMRSQRHLRQTCVVHVIIILCL